jgi:hypothetical protein
LSVRRAVCFFAFPFARRHNPANEVRVENAEVVLKVVDPALPSEGTPKIPEETTSPEQKL